MKKYLLTTAGKMIICYAVWGVIYVCDPVLISEKAAQKSKILEIAKAITDLTVVGCKLAFAAPLFAVSAALEKIGS